MVQTFFKFKLINGNCVIDLEVLEVQVFPGLGNAFFEGKAVALESITARASVPLGEVMHQCAAERRGPMPVGNTQEGRRSIRSPLRSILAAAGTPSPQYLRMCGHSDC